MRTLFTCCLLLALALPARAQEQPPEQPAPVPQGKLTLAIDPGGHTEPVVRAFFDPNDTNRLITLGEDGAVRLWDVAEGRSTGVIYPPGVIYPAVVNWAGKRSFALSKDGKRLAVTSRHSVGGKDEYVVYVLGLPEGRIEKVLWRQPTSVSSLAFSPDGKRLAVGLGSPRGDPAFLVDLTGDSPAKALPLVWKTVTDLAFAPDGKRLAVCLGGKGAILDVASPWVQVEIKGNRVAWSPDGNSVAGLLSGGSGGWLYDEKGKQRHILNVSDSARDVCFSPDSRTVLLVSSSGSRTKLRATLFDVASGKAKVRFFPDMVRANGGAFSPDGKLVALVGGGGINPDHIVICHAEDGRVHRRFGGGLWLSDATDFDLAWSKDGKAVGWLGSKDKDTHATFDLARLGFAETLDKDQRHEHLFDKDGDVIKKGPFSLWRPRTKKHAYLRGDRTELGWHPTGSVSPDLLYFLRKDVHLLRIVPTDQAKAGQRPPHDPRQTLKPLLTLYRKGQDWVIWTEEGYYAATPGGERLITWKVDNGPDQMPSIYSAERFRKQLHRPDVIKKAFELGSVAAALKALDGDKAKAADLEQLLPPKSSLKIVKDAGGQVTVQVSAEAQVKSQPVVAVRLLLDGRPLPEGAGLKGLDPPQAKVTTEFTLTLPPGQHKLSVLARSEDASALSEAVTVGQVVAAQQPVLHLLAIGINDYQNGIDKLNCAVNDAKDLAKAFPLVKQGGLFRDVKTHTLLDQEATTKAVRARLAELKAQLKQEDVLVVFFAGHGVMEDREFFLLTVEADLQKLKTSALSGTELSKTLRDLSCSQVLLLLDACHSGAFPKGRRPATDDAARALADDEVGVTVLAAAMGHQKALEKDGNGYFTAAIKEALAGGEGVPRNIRDHRLYVSHLYTHVLDVVGERSSHRQQPFLSLPSTVAPFALRQFAKK